MKWFATILMQRTFQAVMDPLLIAIGVGLTFYELWTFRPWVAITVLGLIFILLGFYNLYYPYSKGVKK